MRKAGAATQPAGRKVPAIARRSPWRPSSKAKAEAITRKAIQLAQDGDTVALRLCMDRLIPVRKDRPVRFELPMIESTSDLPKASGALLEAVAAGDITPSEAADVGRALDAHMKAIETMDLHERMCRIEEAAR